MGVSQIVMDGYRSALPTLVVSAIGGLLAGVLLGGMKAQLATVQGLLVMIPAFLAIRGSVYGALGSRLSSALHQGLLDPHLTSDDRLVAAVLAGATVDRRTRSLGWNGKRISLPSGAGVSRSHVSGRRGPLASLRGIRQSSKRCPPEAFEEAQR
jgi:hypothetical protein